MFWLIVVFSVCQWSNKLCYSSDCDFLGWILLFLWRFEYYPYQTPFLCEKFINSFLNDFHTSLSISGCVERSFIKSVPRSLTALWSPTWRGPNRYLLTGFSKISARSPVKIVHLARSTYSIVLLMDSSVITDHQFLLLDLREFF